MKTVLAIWHSGSKGKSGTLREFANLLLTTYPSFGSIFPNPATIPPDGDFRLVVKINGIIIGIESKGDPNTNLRERLVDLSDNFHCDIILCSTRTRGDTVNAVEHLHSSKGFQLIWTSTYQIVDESSQLPLNQLKARHLLELLNELSLL
jgi:hypothetical protein